MAGFGRSALPLATAGAAFRMLPFVFPGHQRPFYSSLQCICGLMYDGSVPEISRFFGIVVFMNYNDHPPPHFHVRYAEQKAIVGIESPTLLEGQLSPRALGLVMEWAAAHRQELLEDWNLARQQQPLKRITPLE